MPLTEATYERVALEDPDGRWELACDGLRRKPNMTFDHNQTGRNLAFDLQIQLPRDQFVVDPGQTRVRVPDGRYFIPDVAVLPVAYMEGKRGTQGLEAYAEPLPLIVEIWSRSTGGYDMREKLDGYRARGDRAIWFIHPYRRTLRRWLRGNDGLYDESLVSRGEIRPVALPDVMIELESLFR